MKHWCCIKKLWNTLRHSFTLPRTAAWQTVGSDTLVRNNSLQRTLSAGITPAVIHFYFQVLLLTHQIQSTSTVHNPQLSVSDHRKDPWRIVMSSSTAFRTPVASSRYLLLLVGCCDLLLCSCSWGPQLSEPFPAVVPCKWQELPTSLLKSRTQQGQPGEEQFLAQASSGLGQSSWRNDTTEHLGRTIGDYLFQPISWIAKHIQTLFSWTTKTWLQQYCVRQDAMMVLMRSCKGWQPRWWLHRLWAAP